MEGGQFFLLRPRSLMKTGKDRSPMRDFPVQIGRRGCPQQMSCRSAKQLFGRAD